MTTAATSLLGLALPVTGELAGTWGTTVNDSITSLLDTAVAGTTTLSTDGDVTLSTTTLAANQARQAILLCSGARTALRTITAPAQSKIYTIINATTGGYSVKLVGAGPTTGVTIVAGESALVAWNGSDFIKISSNSTFGAITVTNLTDSALTSGRVVFTSSGGLLVDSANLLYSGTDLTVYGITVGRGAGGIASNTAVGYSALGANTSGSLNTAVGYQAGAANTTAAGLTLLGYQTGLAATAGNITAVGYQALLANTTGLYNTAIGQLALYSNTTASNNTAVGYQAAYSNATGAELVAIGYQALRANTGSSSTAVGYLAGYGNTTGTYNTSFGRGAGYTTTTGSYNLAVGGQSLVSNSTGSNNVAMGHEALSANTTASNNTAVGYQAGYSNTTGTNNNFSGFQSGFWNTTGSQNTAFGVGSYASATTTATGSNNSSFGYQALYSNTTASNNTAVGYQAGYNNTTGTRNTAVGSNAGYSKTTSSYGTYVGYNSGLNNTGEANTFVGDSSGYTATSGTYNTFVGQSAGYFVSTGAKNTVIGSYNGNQGGLDIRTASNYIVLSDGDGNPRLAINGAGPTMLGNYTYQNYGGSLHVPSIIAIVPDNTGNAGNRNWAIQPNGSQAGSLDFVDSSANNTWPNNAYRVAVTSYGINLGGATNTSGMGITFPATQSASSNANTLDDYEEGDWTPVPSPNTGSFTTTSVAGNYVKIGRQVTVNGYISVSDRGTATGLAGFSGLPFTSNASSNAGASSACREQGNTGVVWTLSLPANSSIVTMRDYANSASISNGVAWVFTLTYEV